MCKPNFPMQGSCRCERVKVEIQAPPILTFICHCRGCQKMLATAYSLTAKIPSDSFSIIEGKPVIGGLHGSPKHYFCPHCMSCLYSRLEGQDNVVNVRMTIFEGLKSYAPFIELYKDEKLPWVQTTAVHVYDKFPTREELGGLMGEYADWTEKVV